MSYTLHRLHAYLLAQINTQLTLGQRGFALRGSTFTCGSTYTQIFSAAHTAVLCDPRVVESTDTEALPYM